MRSFEAVAAPQPSPASPCQRLPKAAQSSRSPQNRAGQMASAQSSAGAGCHGVPGVESQMEELLRKIGKPVHFMERRQDTASLCLSDLARHDHDFRQAVLDSETADDRRRLPARPSQARVAAQAGGLADDKPEGPLR